MKSFKSLTREILSPLRDAASGFLIVYLWDRCGGEDINHGAALSAIRQLRDELNRLAVLMQQGGGHD